MNSDFPRWPNPLIRQSPGSRENTDLQITNRIKTLIEMVSPEFMIEKNAINTANWLPEFQSILEKNREIRDQIEQGSIQLPRAKPALERLLYLQTSEYLTSNESDELAKRIWGSQMSQQALPNTGLLAHALLLLPAPDAEQAKALVCRHLYEHSEEVLMNTQKEQRIYPSPEIQRAIMIYESMANAAVNEKIRLFPNEEQSLILFDRLIAWRPWKSSDDTLTIKGSGRKALTDSIGNALSYAIVPVLSIKAKTVERFEQLQAFYREVDGAYAVIPAFVYFAAINDEIASAVKNLVQKALQGRDAHHVGYAALALQKWSELSETAAPSQLNSLISRLIIIIESGRTVGLQQLFLVAGELFKKELLSNEQVNTLKEAVANAFFAAEYVNIDPASREAISASSIREAYAKLAIILICQHPNDHSLQNILKESQADALPEVRFSIEFH